MEALLVRDAGLRFTGVLAGKLNRFLSLKTFWDLLYIPAGILQAIGVVRRWSPDVVLTCGGYVAVPAGIAAALCRVPLVALQQDEAPNLANRLIAPLATVVGVSFASSLTNFAAGKAVWVGNPVRSTITSGSAARARAMFGLPDGLPVVFITGGSQGARSLNRLVLAELPRWLENAVLVHQCGSLSEHEAAQAWEALPPALRERYIVRPYIGEGFSDVLACAELVVSRAGASTIAELAAARKAAVLVPLPPGMGGSPQERNARVLELAGAASVVLERDTSAAELCVQAMALLGDQQRLDQLRRNVAAFDKPGAAVAVADLLYRHAQRSR